MNIDEHLGDIHVKLSYLEDTIETLNSVVIEQQNRIEFLEKDLERLKAQGVEAQGLRTKANEPPPHY